MRGKKYIVGNRGGWLEDVADRIRCDPICKPDGVLRVIAHLCNGKLGSFGQVKQSNPKKKKKTCLVQHHCAPSLKRRRRGCCLHISSLVGLHANVGNVGNVDRVWGPLGSKDPSKDVLFQAKKKKRKLVFLISYSKDTCETSISNSVEKVLA